MDYSDLLDYCSTDRQREMLLALKDFDSHNQLAKEWGIGRRSIDKTVKRVRQLAARKGYSPQHDMTKPTADGYMHYGTSGLYGADGDLKLQWVKTRPDLDRQVQIISSLVDSLQENIIPSPKIQYEGGKSLSNHFSVFPIGDPHIGLLCWAKEVNNDWDVEIAKRVFKSVFERLLMMMPATEEAILVNTGDLFHTDNILGITSRGGHHLDLDGRHGKWIDAAMIIVRMWVETLLRRYKKVHYVNVIGNHDDILGRFMGGFVQNLYQDNPRLTCQVGDNAFQYAHREKVLLGFSHGHTTKLNNLPGKMADDVPELWGQSSYRHWFTGHVHHNQFVQFKEHPGCSVESVGIIPPKDSHSHGGAYGARRGTQGIIFDKEHGEMSMRRETLVRASD